jgi:hypothetical protein
VFLRHSIKSFVLQVYYPQIDCICILFSRNLLGLEKDILFAFAYIPPEGSTVYNTIDDSNGICSLEVFLSQTADMHDAYIVCVGDLNSRLGTRQDFICDDSCAYIPVGNDYDVDSFSQCRNSKDLGQNSFGTSLRRMCCNLGIHVLNGRTDGDSQGEFTFISHLGKSVIDYVIASSALFNHVIDFRVLECDISHHFPISAFFRSSTALREPSVYNRVVYRWNDKCSDDFVSKQDDDTTTQLLHNFYDELPVNVNGAVDILCSIAYHVGESMRVYRGQASGQPKWWNDTCNRAKVLKYQHLNRFRETNVVDDFVTYKGSKNNFKRTCEVAQREYDKGVVSEVCRTFSTPMKMWENLKQFTRKKGTSNPIPTDTWLEYFQSLLAQANNPVDADMEQAVDECLENFNSGADELCEIEDLDGPITEEEIVTAMQHMKNGKASGPDGIALEMLKFSHVFVPCLVVLYNHILQTGVYPKKWCEGIICPIHKKGDKNDANNYRGISLLNVMSKVFTKIISDQLVVWAESNNKLCEEQCGFRRGYSTMDNCFTLQAMVQKYISRPKGRLYCLFIDFSKAFDCVNHKLLFYVLLKNGASSKVVKLIVSMYSQLKSCINVKDGLSEYFACNVGTRQGCMLSPFLFVVFLNELLEMMKANECKGVFVNENATNVFQLYFADDIADTADTVIGMQKHIDTLQLFCETYGMRVNLDKTKIIVFRRGGYLKRQERWFFQGKQVECVSYYKYLGLLYSAFLGWGKARENLAQQAEKAMNILLSFIRKYDTTTAQAFYLFDHSVSPILCYGAEVWGYEQCESIERVHYKCCKNVLKVSSNTSNAAVLGETGRHPLHIIYITRCIKYWLRLLSMDTQRYPRACYDMLVTLDNCGRSSWVTKVRQILFAYGFGYTWISQSVGNSQLFVYEFKQRLRDMSSQNWSETISNSPKLRTYSLFKSQLQPELYLSEVCVSKFRTALCRFRVSSHKLQIELGRHDYILKDNRLCKHCQSVNILAIEDEMHMLLTCPLYSNLRKRYGFEFKYTSIERFVYVLASENKCVLSRLAACDFYAFELRKNTHVFSL